MDVSPAPRGACPRVWAPMPSGDGLIVRIHAPRDGLSAHTLRALVALAREHGNGQLELTRRANLQLRGVREAALSQLQTALVRLGLAPADPDAELRQVLLVNPLSGLDPACAPLEDAASQIERALRGLDPRLELPAKFGILLDSGASLFHELSADIVADVRAAPHDLTAGKALDGAPAAAQLVHLSVAESGLRAPLGACRVAELHKVLQRLIALLDRHTRMRDLLAVHGAAALRAHVEALLLPAPPPPPAPRTAPLIGFRRGARDWFGLAVPFGSGEPHEWLAVAQLAEDFGDASLRLSPSRALLLPGVRAQDAVRLEQVARQHGLITDPEAPLLRAIACPGAPACGSARGETRALARQLARELLPRLEPGASLHVSGCGKSCASRAPARVTIVRDGEAEKLGFDTDAVQVASSRAIPRALVLQRLKEMAAASRYPMTSRYDYERDAAEIYRRSFQTIRAEALLARFSPLEERVVVRLIHTCGIVELAQDVQFSEGFAESAARALANGAPILCDAKMVASGVTRARLPADNEVLCWLDDARVPALAREQNTTRSAAALTLWAERMGGALVAIGNAPTALFRLLELLDAGAPRPAAVIGVPVGFIGAAESKQALIEDGRVPALIVRGRKGGSAMAAAAVNALASERE